MSTVFLLLIAAEVQLYSVPCADIWRAAVPAWSSLGLRSVSLDRPGGTAVLAASFAGPEATRRIKQWTLDRMPTYRRLAVDVTLSFDSKIVAGMECCELRVEPVFNVTWSTVESPAQSSGFLEKSLVQSTTRNATKRAD